MLYICSVEGKCYPTITFYIMTLQIFSARKYSTRLKATIQGTGKLGFTAETSKSLQLSPDSCIKIASDGSDEGTLYLIVCNGPDDDGFRVNYISKYYSLPTTVLFKELGIDYVNNTVMFDLVRVPALDEEVEGKVYRMDKRLKPKNKKEADMR